MVPQTTVFSDDSDYQVVSYCPFCKPSTYFLSQLSVFAAKFQAKQAKISLSIQFWKLIAGYGSANIKENEQ
jgi:hypothetical protein